MPEIVCVRWRFPTANDFGSEIIPASAREFLMKVDLMGDPWILWLKKDVAIHFFLRYHSAHMHEAMLAFKNSLILFAKSEVGFDSCECIILLLKVYGFIALFEVLRSIFLQAYLFNDYWEDIGTIRSFFEANLALTEQVCTKRMHVQSL